MHGLAGSAALILLGLEAVQSWQLGLVWIALFGAGSIAGMALLSLAIGVPLRLSARRLGPARRDDRRARHPQLRARAVPRLRERVLVG